jgi:hypothetical protein
MESLLQIRHKMADSMSHMPRYLCTESVERKTVKLATSGRGTPANSCPDILSARENPKAKTKLTAADRLRVDVAVSGDNEVYSWVGAGQLGDRSLDQIVREGATATGTFRGLLESIFVADVARVEFKGQADWNGRQVLNYAFSVPLERSRYLVSNGTEKRLTAYSGAFTADAHTLDLLKLEIHADSLAPELQMCAVTSTLDYSQVRLNHVDFPLPSEVNMRIIHVKGIESDNRTVFTACHEFVGESTLIVGDEKTAGDAVSATQPAVVLPAGLIVSVALAQKIDPATGAAGDLVKGTLTKPISVPSLGLTIPTGTPLVGRITELLVQYDFETQVTLGLKWESIEFSGIKHDVEMALRSQVAGTAKVDDVQIRGLEHGEGLFVLFDVPGKYQIPAGFESEWITATPNN